jgi:hypothetical protein
MANNQSLPLGVAYKFLESHGLETESRAIRNSKPEAFAPRQLSSAGNLKDSFTSEGKPASGDWDSRIRRGMVLEVVRLNGLYEPFIRQVYPHGGTEKGKAHIRIYDSKYELWKKTHDQEWMKLPWSNRAGESPTKTLDRGAGREQDPEVRKSVEIYAMRKAEEYFRKQGFAVQDKSDSEPYDLLCTRRDEELFVEVKGTTGGGESVSVTRNEVRHVEEHPTTSVLFCLHSINVTRGEPPKCSGGQTRILWPWDLSKGKLHAISYEYVLPAES